MKRLVPVLCAALLAAGAAHAGQMKPGLWEMTMKSDAMKNLPKIPPEQMEQMRKMGIAVPQMSDQGMVTRVCISKAMAERDQTPEMAKPQHGCETKNLTRSGNSYAVDIVCNSPQLKGQGTAKGSFSGNESFSSTYEFKGTANGQPVSERHESKGRWLGADCGNLPPVDAMMKK